MLKLFSEGWTSAPLPVETSSEAQTAKIAKLLEKHHRFMRTGEGNPGEIIREIRHLRRAGYLDGEQAQTLRSAIIPTDAEIRLRRIAAGQDPEVVYDNPWKRMAHLIAYVAWFAVIGGAIEFFLNGVLGGVAVPKNIYLAIALGLAGFFAWVSAGSFAHDRTTGRIIERYFRR